MEDIILIGLFAVLVLVFVLKRQSYMSPAPGPAPCTLTPPPAGRTCKTRSKDGSAITIADGLKCPSEYSNLVSAGCGLNYCCQ
jgi:hypothetical protein